MGELVTFRASINHAGRTSMEVGIRVEAEDIRSGSRRQHLAASSGRAGQPRQAGEASAPRSCPPTIVAHHTATGRKHLELGASDEAGLRKGVF